MIIKSLKLGELEIAEENLITFPKGIFGFEELRRMAVIKREESCEFFFLQSVEDLAVTFVCVEPFVFFPEYQVDLDDELLEVLQITQQEQVYILCLATIPQIYQDATANLMAPVVMNLEQRLAQQVILDKSQYKTRHPLFSQPENNREKG